MQDYKKLVEALRCCASGACDSEKCDYMGMGAYGCMIGLAQDAADAIEALLKENKELIEDHPEMVEADGHWEWRKPNGEVLMPKRGEWKITTERFTPELICSECGVHIPCVAGWCMDAHMNYCPNCGAKMFASDTNVLNKHDTTDGPIITPCRGCSDYDGYGGCKSKGGCARAKMEVQDGKD